MKSSRSEMRFLLDTNVLSEAIRPQPDSAVLSWLTQHTSASAISVLSLGEIWRGIEQLPEGSRRESYREWFQGIETDFLDRVVPVDAQIMRAWGTYAAQQQRRGKRLLSFDSLLAATALHYGMTIATRNTADFPDVPMVNPWEWGN